jgi:succinate dehydrogenase / fumarate reductase membrane anchor subunit
MKFNRPLGSTHRGTIEWLVQRVSAIYIAVFLIYVLTYLICHPVLDYTSWSAHMVHRSIRLVWGLFFLCLLLHAWTGLRSIYLDYLHAVWLRLTVTVLTVLGLITMGLWAVDILLRGVV